MSFYIHSSARCCGYGGVAELRSYLLLISAGITHTGISHSATDRSHGFLSGSKADAACHSLLHSVIRSFHLNGAGIVNCILLVRGRFFYHCLRIILARGLGCCAFGCSIARGHTCTHSHSPSSAIILGIHN